MALEQYEAAYRLSDEMGRDVLLQSLAEAAVEAKDPKKAREYAGLMLSRSGSGWNRGNNIHKGNIVLGRIALAEGDLAEAKRRLIEAGKTPGSPQLGSFGPTMTLARDLLQQGERETVLAFLAECAKFWDMGQDRLEQWSAAVREGKTPDFGANLNY